MSGAETFGEEVKGHGALAAGTAGCGQNSGVDFTAEHSTGVQCVSQKKGHSALRFKYTLTSPKPSAREAAPFQTSSSLIFKIYVSLTYV